MKLNGRAPTWIAAMIAIAVIAVASLLLSPHLAAASGTVLTDFEGGTPAGWFTFNGSSTVETVTQVVADTDPLALPDQTGDNEILANTFDVSDFGGFGQDIVIDFGGPQNWSNFPAFEFWFYGTGSGLTYQAEISDNRSDPNSDTSERFDYEFTDSAVGWQFMSIPFADFTRATDFQPGGAPDDGFTLTEIWAWAIVLPQGADTIYFDDFGLGQRIVDDFESGLPMGVDADGVAVGFDTFSGGSPITITTTITPPAPVPGSSDGNGVMQMDVNVVAYAGFIHAFENEAVDTWVSQDWSTYEGIQLWLHGDNSGADMFIDLLDNRNPGATTDDAERWTVAFKDDFAGWKLIDFPFADFTRKEIGNGAPNDGLGLTEVHGWALGALGTDGPRSYYIDDVALYGVAEAPELAVSFAASNFEINEGDTGEIVIKLNRAMNEDDPAQVSVDYATEPGTAVADRDYTPTSGTLTFVNGEASEQSFALETFTDGKALGNTRVILRLSNLVDVAGIITQGSAIIVDNDVYDPNLIDDFERGAYLLNATGGATLTTPEIAAGDPMAIPGQGAYEHILEVTSPADATGVQFGRDFAIDQDWSRGEALRFWYYGINSGETVGVQLKENRAVDPGPTGWQMVWSDEFEEAAGTPPNPAHWTHEISDVTPDGKNGWGNEELQYYTDSVDNAATDGNGNLVITVQEADGSRQCYYGPCEYTSARLISWHKAEFAYGRIESRILVPQGSGIWPAFWSLGNDIDRVPWPQNGEIDFMEFVGREPNEVFGTIHGPGYAGGASFGGTYTFNEPVFNDYHTFAVEWQPDLINWYVDDMLYHTATPADVDPNEWVFNDPIFMLLNVAIGGNFGGPVGDETTFPQSMTVDYVRVYQAPDTAERFDASFVDNFSGWQQVSVPFADFTRSAGQAANAPDDGLTLGEVWGYGFTLPDSLSESVKIDQVRLELVPPPTAITVTNLDDSGDGSLRQALDLIGENGTVTFSLNLSGTIALTSGPLTPNGNVTVDASAAPGLIIDGGGSDRVLVVDAGQAVSMTQLTLTNGYAAQLGGGVLNNGALTLDHVAVISNTMTTDAGDFWQGGGGIYNGDGATLNLIDSTVADNSSGWAGGGIYSFFNTTTSIVRSTISGNVAMDVGGGLRVLGNGEIVNSTVSGNISTAWHGGAIFQTDGTMKFIHSTVTGNQAPDGAAGAIFVGTFGESNAAVELVNTIVADNANFNCVVAVNGSGAVTLTADGSNVFSDDSCNPGASDQVVDDAGLEPLADNTGPTLTHALTTESPALNTANGGGCPETDQRGETRPQGPACDVGAFELVPTAIDDVEPTAPSGSFFIFVPAVQN